MSASQQPIRISNCRYIENGEVKQGNVEINNNLVKAASGDQFDEDGKGQLLIPGIVDLAVRSDDLATSQAAANKTGISYFCIQPDSCSPALDKAAVAQAMQLKIESHAPGALMLGACTQSLAGEQLAEMAALKDAGCIALTDAGHPWQSNRTLKRAMEYAKSIDIALHLTAQDNSLADGGCAHAGTVAAQLGLPGIPSSSESGALAMMLELVEETGARVHFCRLSTARSVKLIERAKQRGLPVTADVSIHNLLLNEEAIRGYNTLCHVQPPLRSSSDQSALIDGINSGIIDAVTSHHQPCSEDDKLKPFPSSRPGIAALELLLPLAITLSQQGELKLSSIIRALTSGPASVLGIETGDWVLCDTDASYTISTDSLIQSQSTPYLGWKLFGA